MSDELKEGEVAAFFIYAGRNEAKQHVHYILTDIKFNDGDTLASKELKDFITEKKIFKHCRVGYILPVVIIDNSTKVRYNKDAIVQGYWKTESDLIEWRLSNSVADTVSMIEKQASDNQLEKLLEPIRRQYKRTLNKSHRAALIAEVIRVVTG